MVGNPTSIRDLEEAGIRKADLFVSVTPEETTNVAASILASKLGAHKTLARINNYEYLLPKNKELFEKMGIVRITERTETLSYRCHQTAERDHYSPWYGSYRIGRYRFFYND